MCVDLNKLDKAAWNPLNQLRSTDTMEINCLPAVPLCPGMNSDPFCIRVRRLHLLRHCSATLVIQAV